MHADLVAVDLRTGAVTEVRKKAVLNEPSPDIINTTSRVLLECCAGAQPPAFLGIFGKLE